MRCDSVYMSQDDEVKLFDFRDPQEENKIHKVQVNYINEVVEDYFLQTFPFSEKKEKIMSHISSMMVYIPNKSERDMFSFIFQHISSLYDYSITLRTTSYPGKELIVVDYGTLSISKEKVTELSKLIVGSISRREVVIEEPEEEVAEEEETLEVNTDEVSDYPLPFVSSDEYDQDEFQIGVVEDD